MAREFTPQSSDGRRTALLGFAVALLVACFRWLPAVVAGSLPGAPSGADSARAALGPALLRTWSTQDGGFSSDLDVLVDYWAIWHATKIVVCGALVLALVLLARSSWRAYLRPGGRGRARWAGTVASVCAALVVVVQLANVQATAAPSIALLLLLPAGVGGPAGEVLAGVRRELALGPPDATGPVATLLDHVATYHRSMALAAGLAAAVALVVAVASWGRRRRAGRDEPRLRAAWTTTAIVAGTSAVAYGALMAVSVAALGDAPTALLDVVGRR